LAVRATPEQYLNRQPITQGIEQPIIVAQATQPQPIIYIVQQADNTILIVVVGAIIIGVIGVLALVALFSKK